MCVSPYRGVLLINNRLKIVILGRPNVGKSTLFNRIFGKRRAITDSMPGVTRDALEENCFFAGIPITLIDTGGIKAELEDEFDSLVANRSLKAMDKGDIILFLLEIGIFTAEDKMLVDKLRNYSEKVILVVNKSDTPEKDYLASEHYSLGLGEPIPISAAHGRNIDILYDSLKSRLKGIVSTKGEVNIEEEEDAPLTISLLGKPNVGKSTLANRLTGETGSLVSEIAGTTRDTVIGELEYKSRRMKIIDTAGIRRKAKVSEDVEYYAVNRAIRAILEADVTLLLIDANEGLSEQDKKIAFQVVKKGRTIVMVLNKWDEEQPSPQILKKAINRIRFQFPILDWAPLLPISALKGYGISKLLDLIFTVDSQQRTRVDTSELNRAVREWVSLTPPPMRKGKMFKVKYVTQISTKPVRFVAFVNRKKEFPDSYRRFLMNKIRRGFGFDLIPVELILREGKQ